MVIIYDNVAVAFSSCVLCVSERGEWERLEQLGEPPPALQEHSATAHGDKLYVFGGEPGSSSSETPLWIYDTQVRHTLILQRSVFEQLELVHLTSKRKTSLIVLYGCCSCACGASCRGGSRAAAGRGGGAARGRAPCRRVRGADTRRTRLTTACCCTAATWTCAAPPMNSGPSTMVLMPQIVTTLHTDITF